MTTESPETGSGPIREQLPRLPLGQITELFSVAGLLCYGVAWIFFDALYSEFGISPEFAGVGLDFLVIRAAVLAGLATGLFATLVLSSDQLARWLSYGREARIGVFKILILLDCFLIFTVAGAATGYSISVVWTPPLIVSISGAIVIAGFVTIFELVEVLRAVDFSSEPPNPPKLGPSLKLRHALAAVFAWLLVLVPAAYAGGHAVGHQVHEGHPILNPLMEFPRIAVSVPPLLAGLSPAQLSPKANAVVCGMRLGTNQDSIVLYDTTSRKIVTLPTNYAITVSAPKRCGS